MSPAASNLSAVDKLPPSKPIPTQARARLKRDALIAAATEDFQTLGYERTTAKTIADRAQVATGTFYQYFHNKDDLLRVIAHERLQQLSINIEEPGSFSADDVTAFFKTIITFVFEFHEEAPRLHQVLEQRRHSDPHLQAILKQAEQDFSLRTLGFVQRFDIDNPEAVAFNLYAMTEGLVHRHVLEEHDEAMAPIPRATKEQVIALGAEMLGSFFKGKTLATN